MELIKSNEQRIDENHSGLKETLKKNNDILSGRINEINETLKENQEKVTDAIEIVQSNEQRIGENYIKFDEILNKNINIVNELNEQIKEINNLTIENQEQIINLMGLINGNEGKIKEFYNKLDKDLQKHITGTNNVNELEELSQKIEELLTKEEASQKNDETLEQIGKLIIENQEQASKTMDYVKTVERKIEAIQEQPIKTDALEKINEQIEELQKQVIKTDALEKINEQIEAFQKQIIKASELEKVNEEKIQELHNKLDENLNRKITHEDNLGGLDELKEYIENNFAQISKLIFENQGQAVNAMALSKNNEQKIEELYNKLDETLKQYIVNSTELNQQIMEINGQILDISSISSDSPKVSQIDNQTITDMYGKFEEIVKQQNIISDEMTSKVDNADMEFIINNMKKIQTEFNARIDELRQSAIQLTHNNLKEIYRIETYIKEKFAGLSSIR